MTLKIGRNRAGGFTFLELIIVILIISVLIGISTPSFRRVFNDKQLEIACLEFTNAFNYARQGAIFDRADYKIKLDPQGRRFWIERSVLGGAGAKFERLKGRNGRDFLLPRGITIESKNQKDSLIFYPDARCDAAVITITNGVKKYGFTTELTRGHIKKYEIKT